MFVVKKSGVFPEKVGIDALEVASHKSCYDRGGSSIPRKNGLMGATKDLTKSRYIVRV